MSPAAQQILKPALDRLHFEGTEIGLGHWHQQNQEVNRQIDAARADRAQADRDSAQALVDDLHEAHHAYDDPAQLQTVAERGDDTWLQIAQRNGWNQQQFDQQRAQWNEKLYGVAMARHLDDGNVPGAKAVLVDAHPRLGLASFAKLAAVTDAGERYIANTGNTAAGGSDIIPTAPAGPANKNREYQIAGEPVGRLPPATDDKRPAHAPPLRDSQGDLAPGPDYILKKTPWISYWVQQQHPLGVAAKTAAQGVKAGDPQIEQDRFVTPFPQALGASVKHSWHDSWLGEGIDEVHLPNLAIMNLNQQQAKQLFEGLHKLGGGFPFPGARYDYHSAILAYLGAFANDQNKKQIAYNMAERALRDAGVKFYTPEEWISSEWYRDGIKFEPFMTPERAQARAELFDNQIRWKYLMDHQSREGIDGFLGGAAVDAAGFVAHDPTVVVPAGAAVKWGYKGLRYGLPFLLEALGGGVAADTIKAAAVPAVRAAVKEGAIGSAISTVTGTVQRVLHPGERPWADLAKEAAIDGLVSAATGGVGRLFRDAPGMGSAGSAAVPPKSASNAPAPSGSGIGSPPAKAGSIGASSANPTGTPHSGAQTTPNAPGTTPAGTTLAPGSPSNAPHLPSSGPLPPLPGHNNPAAAWQQIVKGPVHQADFASQMAPFQKLGLIKTEADVAKFARLYDEKKILLPMPAASTKTPGEFVLQGNKGSITVDPATKERSFHVTETLPDRARSERYVVNAAKEIEQAYPGQIVCISCHVVDLANGTSKEIDILTRNFAIEIKRESATGLATQTRKASQWSGMPAIAYAPEAYSVVNDIRRAGGLATNRIEELLKLVKPPGMTP